MFPSYRISIETQKKQITLLTHSINTGTDDTQINPNRRRTRIVFGNLCVRIRISDMRRK